ncbi:MAG: phosphonate ABC transporter, permease protein PhnE [Chloroflexota bacterium]|nr:phosphonate ABC transporter, permease protein PhnE [Chloroflexota bacterium]MDE3192745.1 phosphonate ABC transporter, permease protein PhnE [Chloroflexota bacterium]
MADYFRARGLAVPPELDRHWYTDWRRLITVSTALVVLGIGFQLTDFDPRHLQFDYAPKILAQLARPDVSVCGPQNEYETWLDGACGLMVVTIFLGIVATLIAVVIALPLSFLAARNLMTGHPVTAAIYTLVRFVFTVMRSIDVLIVVILAAVIFGIGTAAGIMALAFHNVGVIGKLYSEAIEGIETGPIEAITATGANRLQVIWTAVVPQLVNPFISFTIYRLDTNVRLAPILGYVGGGGIGVMLFQNIQLLNYRATSFIILLIIATVAVMDFLSAQVRKRLA